MHNRPSALNYTDCSTSCTGISEWHFYEAWLLLKHSHKHINGICSSEGTDNICAAACDPIILGRRSVVFQLPCPTVGVQFSAGLCSQSSAAFSDGMAFPGRLRWTQSSRARGSPCVHSPGWAPAARLWGRAELPGRRKQEGDWSQ